MKIHIMTDMEGVAGVMGEQDYIYANSRYYEEARELATLEVSAAVEGAFEAGATEVLVADGHGPGAIKRQLLHPRAKLLGGRPFHGDLAAFGLDGTFAATLMIGQHAKANTDGGHLCHTMSFSVEEYKLNGLVLGEIGLWMLIAGYFHVPTIFVSGDQAACEEARALVPNIETAAVKWGLKRGSASGLTAQENASFNTVAVHLHPNEARALIRERVFRAVKRIPEIMPFCMEPPYTLTILKRPEKPGGRMEKKVIRGVDLLDLMTCRNKPGKPLAVSRKPQQPAPKGAKPRSKR